MRRLALLGLLAAPLVVGCQSTTRPTQEPFAQPNELMGQEIRKRIAEIPDGPLLVAVGFELVVEGPDGLGELPDQVRVRVALSGVGVEAAVVRVVHPGRQVGPDHFGDQLELPAQRIDRAVRADEIA